MLVTPWLIFGISHSFQSKTILWNPTRHFRGVIHTYLWILVILGFASKASYLEEKHWTTIDHLGARAGRFPTKIAAMAFEATKEKTTEILDAKERQ